MASLSLMLRTLGTSLVMRSTSAKLHFEHAAHVFDGGARAQRVEGDDLRHLLAAVFLGDVLDHFAAAVHAEIDVDIGHADALGIEEALEQQAVLQRVDIGDRHGVADQAAGGRTAARADGDVLRFGVADEVPDDQEVARELHLLDHLDFAIQALGVFGEIVLEHALGAHGFEARRGASRIPGARRTRSRCRWSAPAGTSNLGNGSLTFSSLTWQRWAISQVRSTASSSSPNSCHHLVARSSGRSRACPSACGWGRSWSCRSGCRAGFRGRARLLCGGSASRWWPPAAGRFRCERRLSCGSEALVLLEVVVLHFEEEIVVAEDVGVGVARGGGRRRTCRRGWFRGCGRAGRRTWR